MRGKMVIGILCMVSILFITLPAFAECPDDKEPVNITTPSGKTKTLCIPAAAVQGIENAAEHSGGTIVASNCPCFSAEDLAAFGEMQCVGTKQVDIYGNIIFANTSCKNVYGKVSITYDESAINKCYYYYFNKLTGEPPITVDETISVSAYDTCASIRDEVLFAK